MQEKKRKILVLDFDDTISDQNIHNKVLMGGVNKYEETPTIKARKQLNKKGWKIVEKAGVEPLGNEGQWKECIQKMLKEGIVCIASFNDYEEIMKKFLVKKVGLTEEEVNQIYIKTGCPIDETSGEKKVEYIKELLTKINKDHPQESPFTLKDIVFVDDYYKNVSAASRQGIKSVMASKSSNFFVRINTALNGNSTKKAVTEAAKSKAEQRGDGDDKEKKAEFSAKPIASEYDYIKECPTHLIKEENSQKKIKQPTGEGFVSVMYDSFFPVLRKENPQERKFGEFFEPENDYLEKCPTDIDRTSFDY